MKIRIPPAPASLALLLAWAAASHLAGAAPDAAVEPLPTVPGAVAPPGPTAPAPIVAAEPLALYLTWQNDPATTITVQWHSDWQAEGYRDTALEYRTAGNEDAPWRLARGLAHPLPYTTRMVHTVEITGLAPDTTHVFRLGTMRIIEPDDIEIGPSGVPEFLATSLEYRFRTLPAKLSRPVRFVSGGDANVSAELPFAAMNRAAAARDPDFAIMGGDIAYANNKPRNTTLWFEFFRVWLETMRAPDGRLIPIVPTIGNHEASGDTFEVNGGSPERGVSLERAAFFYGAFAFPGLPGYNALDFGDYLSVVALDSFHTNPVAGEQTEWLRGVLASRRGFAYVVPVYHVPAYPAHRPFDGPVAAAIRDEWVPLFEKAGVRFVFENHDHLYKRTFPLRSGQPEVDGIRYLGDGAWSVALRTPHPAAEAPYIERSESRHHVFVVTLHRDRADFAAIDPAGVEFDRFTISRKP